MPKSRQDLGAWGESLASEYLRGRGYEILDQNVRTPYGEIDLVAIKGSQVRFVEVKTRRSSSFGYPEDAVTQTKKERMVHSALAFMQEHPELGQNWQIDVIGIQCFPGQKHQVTHFENAIDG